MGHQATADVKYRLKRQRHRDPEKDCFKIPVQVKRYDRILPKLRHVVAVSQRVGCDHRGDEGDQPEPEADGLEDVEEELYEGEEEGEEEERIQGDPQFPPPEELPGAREGRKGLGEEDLGYSGDENPLLSAFSGWNHHSNGAG